MTAKKRLVHFHGDFKNKYSETPLEIHADSIFNLLNLLFKIVYPTFMKQEDYFIIAFENKDGSFTELFDPEQVLTDDQRNIHIIPNPDGSAWPAWVVQVIIAVIAVGVSLLLAPKLNSSQDTASGANWSTPENVVGQGGVMPVVLGETLVGSRVASYGIDSTIYQERA